MQRRHSVLTYPLFYCITILLTIFCQVAPAAPFYYQGKTLTVVQGWTPGGSADVRTRVVIRYLQKHIPGSPTIVSRYMPGGGGTVATNYIAVGAKHDGLTIGTVSTSLYSKAFLNERGIRYKLEDFAFLGSPAPGNPQALVIRPALKISSVEKLKTYKGLRFAQRSVGHSLYIYDRLIAYVLELKDPKWVVGYSSTEIPIAVQKGEADARITSLVAFMRNTPHWLEEGFTIPITIKNARGQGSESLPEFPQGIPTLDRYADTDLKKSVLEMHKAMRPSGSPFIVARTIPPVAMSTLKEAFNKIWNDPEFRVDFEKATAGERADPMSGEEIESLIFRKQTNKEIKNIYKQIISAGPLPRAR